MDTKDTIRHIVNLTERLASGRTPHEQEITQALKLIKSVTHKNLEVYTGYLSIHFVSAFKKNIEPFITHTLTSHPLFQTCLELIKGSFFSPENVGKLFLDILSLPDDTPKTRDHLLGCFYAATWIIMNDPKHFDLAVEYGVAITQSAFSLDHFKFANKPPLAKSKNCVTISISGSGKKGDIFKILNISSMSAVITAAVGLAINKNILVAKVVSRGTSSATGSTDIFELAGVQINLPSSAMVEIANKTKIGIFDINTNVPILNRVYDQRLYNTQIFAGSVGGAAIVCPVGVDLINYGLSRGSQKLCLAILKKIYPTKNIVVLTGKNNENKQAIDQISVVGETIVAEQRNMISRVYSIPPELIGLRNSKITEVQSKGDGEANLREFVKLLRGKSGEGLQHLIAMEVAINLYSSGVVDNLMHGASLALRVIQSGEGINVLEQLVLISGGDINPLRKIIHNIS